MLGKKEMISNTQKTMYISSRTFDHEIAQMKHLSALWFFTLITFHALGETADENSIIIKYYSSAMN